MQTLSFVTLKAFGDFVIAYNCLQGRIDSSAHYIGEHLQELARAVDINWLPRILEHGEQSIPAAFDIRKQGLTAAAQSIIGLRRAIEKIPSGSLLVFDRLTTRAKIIANGRAATCLPAEPNIYLAYDAFLEAHGKLVSIPATPNTGRSGDGKIRIFAGSRIDAKKIPLALCHSLVRELKRRYEIVEIVALVGEYPALEASNLPKLILPRGFDRMINVVGESRAIISADSLSAHLAELKGFTPVVVSPVVNSYWLPRSSFQKASWSLFHQGVSGVLGALERADA